MTALAGVTRNDILGLVYFVRTVGRPLVKVGWTVDATKRLKSLQCANPDELALLGVVEGTLADEAAWHERLKPHHVRGEWFTLNAEVEVDIRDREAIAEQFVRDRQPPSGLPDWLEQRIEVYKLRQFASNNARNKIKRLDEDQVRAILVDRRAVRTVAADYGVGTMTIQNIRSRQTWKHISAEVDAA